MYSAVATRVALRRVAFAPVSRTVAIAKRYSSTVSANDPQVIESEKQRNLKKEQHKTSTPIRNAPGWNEYLATDAEADIKADRSDFTPEEMTSETVKHVKSRHHGEERIDAYEASYERDETTGPLRNSPPKETVVKTKERVVHKVQE